MRVEDEGCNAKRHDGEPEVDEERSPNSHCGVKEDEDKPHAHIDARTGEARIKNGERHASGGESTTSGDVSSSTEGQIALDGLRIDLGGEDFKNGKSGGTKNWCSRLHYPTLCHNQSGSVSLQSRNTFCNKITTTQHHPGHQDLKP